MKVEVLEEEENRIKIKVVGEKHMLLNLLRKELWEDESVEFAGYREEHPLKEEMTLIVRTKGKKARTAVVDAVKRCLKNLEQMKWSKER